MLNIPTRANALLLLISITFAPLAHGFLRPAPVPEAAPDARGPGGFQRAHKPGSVGVPIPGAAVRFVHPDTGERLVAASFPGAYIVRPSVMFGRDDAFLSNLKMATRLPVVPLFGAGDVRMQPAWVDDVAQAIARLVGQAQTGEGGERVFEFGGAQTLSYREAVAAVCAELDRRRLLLPVPLGVWKVLARAMGVLPNPPLTIDQIYLLAKDNTVNPSRDGFAQLGMQPAGMRDLLGRCLARG